MSIRAYRGNNTANPRRVFISGQKRGVFGTIKRELRRKAPIRLSFRAAAVVAVEPVAVRPAG